ncbi:MAG: hypothetical protein NTW86_20200 [Candidatus Sumerlaeota bacterium]|nr:hypothetical protein [Candidatus Sumerlaeota bacterium]
MSSGVRRRADAALKAAAGVVVAALALQSAGHVAQTARRCFARDDTTYPECAVVERAWAAARGEPLYADPYRWPYAVVAYGPLNYYPEALWARATGLKLTRLEQSRQIYLAGRAVSFAAGVAIVAWLWSMGPALGLRGAWRLLPPLLLLSSARMLVFWPSFRPDYPATALAVWGWAAALRRRRTTGALTAAGLLALAVLIKQTAVLSAVVLAVWLLVDGRRREAAWFGAAWGGACAACCVVLIWSTHGLWWTNLAALSAPWRPSNCWRFLLVFRDVELLPLAGGLAVCAVRPWRREETRPARWAFVLAFLSAELLMARCGSDTNYYLEAWCWGALLAGRGIRDLAPAVRPEGRRVWGWALVLALLLGVGVGRFREALSDVRGCFGPTPSWTSEAPRLAEFLQGVNGPVFLEDGYGWWLTGSPPTVLDRYMYSARAAAGDLRWDELRHKIEKREFQAIVLKWSIEGAIPSWQGVPFCSEAVRDTIREQYCLGETMDRYWVYVPRR